MSNMRKSTIYALLALLVWTMAMPATAQKKQQRSMKNLDPEATVEAVKVVLEKHQDLGGQNLVETEMYPLFKKNPEMLTNIGKAYSLASDSDHAVLFTKRALEVNPKYVPAYIAMGDIYKRWSALNDSLKYRAYEWYDKAIAIDPKNPQGYKSFADLLAKTDQVAAINKMNEILEHVPDYDVNLYAARLYFDLGGEYGLENSYNAFKKTNVNKLNSSDIASYVTVLRLKKDYASADSVLQIAKEKYPTHAGLNRFRLQNYISLENWNAALEAVETLNKSDSLELDLEDYVNYGLAYKGLKRYKNAIEIFQKCVDFEIKREDFRTDERYENAKKQEINHKSTAMQEIALSYKEMGFWEEAIAEQKKYIEYRKSVGKLDAPEIGQLGTFYQEYADELQIMNRNEERLEAIKNWYDTWGLLAEVAPHYAVLAYEKRILIASNFLDPGNKNGYALPDAEKIVEIVPTLEEPTQTDKNRLKQAVRYLINYYTHVYKGKDNLIKIGPYWRILGELDPTDDLYKVYDTKQSRRLMGFK